MPFTAKQAKMFGGAIREAYKWATKSGGRLAGTPKGQYVIKTSAKKIYSLYKKKGLGEVLRHGPGIASDITMKTWLKKPPLDFKKSYEAYRKGFIFKHTEDPLIHEAKKVKLLSMEEWAKTKVAGVHYMGDLPKFDTSGGFLGQRVTRHIWRKVAAGSALTAAAGYATDKGNLSGYVEGPKGARVEAFTKTLTASNEAGRGGHWAAGAAVKTPGGIAASGGWNVGIGYAKKAGIAHQLGGHLNISTPVFKTGIRGEGQHAFGLKSRSRRVASIRRAVFGQEQHLGVSKKLNKSQRARDTLY
jgi:hypothetical protein